MPRPDVSSIKWIEKGYECFALDGPGHLSINAISKAINSPRASFYHHFSDMDIFIDALLETHLQVLEEFIAEGSKTCTRLMPDLYQLLEKYQLGLKFSRQLFQNRHLPTFGYIFFEVFNRSVDTFILNLFIQEYNLDISRQEARKIWLTFTESWYTRINPNDLQAAPMQAIAEEVMVDILKFLSSDFYNKTV